MDDLVKRLRNSGSRTEIELHEDREEAADRIEADAKRIAELALDALTAHTQADEAYQAQRAAEARIEELEAALQKAKDLIDDQYACAEAQALHGEYVAKEARPVWIALCAALGEKKP